MVQNLDSGLYFVCFRVFFRIQPCEIGTTASKSLVTVFILESRQGKLTVIKDRRNVELTK